MAITENKIQQQTQQPKQQPAPSPTSQQQMQQEAPSPAAVAQRSGQQAFTDPLGRPMHQGTPRFTDQQVGGDLTGNTSDARDDNFVRTGTDKGQNTRDVSAHVGGLPAASAELLRSVAVVAADAGQPVLPAQSTRPPISEQDHADAPEPDGTEDPGANADDSLAPRREDGTQSESH